MKKILLLLPFWAVTLFAKPIPAGLFTDNAVLQRERPLPVWGTADAGERVTVSFAGKDYETTADASGKWRITMDSQPASSEPRTLEIKGNEAVVTLKDVLVGEVWIASGQSNMEFIVANCENAAEEIATANFPLIRQFDVPNKGSLQPEDSVSGQWVACSPATAGQFTGVGYFFARDLFTKLGVPIGVINSSFGGTPAEAWTAKQALFDSPEFRESAAAAIAKAERFPADQAAFPGLLAAWENENGVADTRNEGFEKGWAAPDFDDSAWKTVSVPFNLKSALDATNGGVFWVRKSVEIPPDAAGKPFSLHLGYLAEQCDTVYFNGEKVGGIGKEPPRFYTCPRTYRIPGPLVKAGKNVIAVRYVAHTQNGGLTIPSTKLGIPQVDPKSISKEWKIAFEREYPPLAPEALAKRPALNLAAIQLTASGLYNAMIHPLIPYGIQGVIWYQGESNTNPATLAEPYRRLFALMIADWRRKWSEGNGASETFPFYFVQLANNDESYRDHRESSWAVLRESQSAVLESTPNTGMAVIIDIGSDITIHPPNKQDVGQRLALWARANTYGEKNLTFRSPRYKSHQIEQGRIRVQFDTGGSPLMIASKNGLDPAKPTPGAKLEWFEIAGADGKFVWADATIDGDSVLVSSPEVPSPTQVRYGWATNPEGCNLYNTDGLPASPFSTPPR